jgi:ABC-type transporter Mla subunit MlaD
MEKLFSPIISPQSTGDYITLFFSSFIIGYFFFELLRLTLKIRKLNIELKSILGNEYNIQENSLILASIWNSYKSTFGFGDLNKTNEDAKDYFNEQSLIFNNSNFRYYLGFPNILVGLGILGTFIGLVYGISSFDLSDSSTIKESINFLLSGMGTAFYTSILGMFTSISFNVFEKRKFHKTYGIIGKLTTDLNRNFRISKIEFENYQHQKMIGLVYEVLGFRDTDGNFVQPSLVFSTIDRELKEQSRALKGFSTDLANSLEAISSIIIDEFDISFQKAFKETLLPVIEKLDGAVEALKNEKSATNENLIINTTDALKETMKNMMKDFQETISGTAKNEMENLIRNLSNSSEMLFSLPELLGKVELTISKASEKFEDVSNNYLNNSQRQEEEVNKNRELINNATNEALDKSKILIESAQSFIENFTQKSESLTNALQQYHFLINSLKQTGSDINETTNKLHSSVELIDRYSTKSIEANKLLSENFERQLSQITQMNIDHIQNYDKIKDSLGEVFKGIEQGLTNYRDHTVSSLNTYLGEFSEKLSKASAALSGSISDLNESLDGLNDFFENLRR